MADPRTAIVLDSSEVTGRRLSESIQTAGFLPQQTEDFTAFVKALANSSNPIGVAAFEAFWPDPESKFQILRNRVPNARLLIATTEESTRSRMAQRLWSVGLFEHLFDRNAAPREIRPLLVQAYADCLLAEHEGSFGSEPASDAERVLSLLSSLTAGLTKSVTVEGLLRTLQTGLPRLLDYVQAQVLLVTHDPVLYVLPGQPATHEVTWALAEKCCEVLQPLALTKLTVDRLQFIEIPLARHITAHPANPPPASQETISALPLVVQGEVVGAFAIALPEELSPSTRNCLHHVAVHLGACLKGVQRMQATEESSLVDELTGAHNRRFLKQSLNRLWSQARRHGFQLTVILIDLDHFKQINDRYGHAIGDQVLASLTKRIQSQLRGADDLIRLGGEEFLIVLPDAGSAEAALVAERLRSDLRTSPIVAGTSDIKLYLTFSAGIANFPECHIGGPDELIVAADNALLKAKEEGRDRTCAATRQGIQFVGKGTDPHDKRRRSHPRIQSSTSILYIDLPHFDGRPIRLDARDLSAGGAGVRGPQHIFRHGGYGLAFVGNEHKPMLTRVAWCKSEGSEKSVAGLRFIRPKDLRANESLIGPTGKALVFSEDKEQTKLVERILRAAQIEAEFVTSEEDVPEAASIGDYSVIIAFESVLRGPLGRQIRKLRDTSHEEPVRLVVINNTGDRRSTLQTISEHRVQHVVGNEPARDESLFATLNKLSLIDQFGIDKYLLWGADIRNWTVQSWEGKVEVLKEVKSAATAMRCHPRIADLLVSAADEMIINALYRSSSEPTPTKPVTVECGSDGRFFGVAVIDEYGSFRAEDMFDALGQALEWGEKGLSLEHGSSRLGFSLILSVVSQLVINVHPGKCTEVIGIIDLRRSLRELRDAIPGLGFFSSDQSE